MVACLRCHPLASVSFVELGQVQLVRQSCRLLQHRCYPPFVAEMEALTRRATLDVIGRAGFGFDFRALEAYAVPGSCKSGIDVVQVGCMQLARRLLLLLC